MFAAVTILRAPDGRVLRRSEWPAPLVGELRITQHHSPSQPKSRAILEANLYEDFGLSRMRNMAHLADVELLPSETGTLRIAGLVREHKGEDLYEHRQIWDCELIAR